MQLLLICAKAELLSVNWIQKKRRQKFKDIIYMMPVTDAVDTWRKGEHCLYKDASGGIELQILLYFAGMRIKETKIERKINKWDKKIIKISI